MAGLEEALQFDFRLIVFLCAVICLHWAYSEEFGLGVRHGDIPKTDKFHFYAMLVPQTADGFALFSKYFVLR